MQYLQMNALAKDVEEAASRGELCDVLLVSVHWNIYVVIISLAQRRKRTVAERPSSNNPHTFHWSSLSGLLIVANRIYLAR